MTRDLVIALLDDEEGISDKAWDLLAPILEGLPQKDFGDILDAVDGCEDRVFLPEDWDR